MSGWKALNIESDDESDIEIDDTKELRIEDALKLYQTALKHHAEGPASFDKAAEAYHELFDSEIFRYPESQTELRRIELYGPLVEDDEDELWTEGLEAGAGVAAASLENGPSTLPQILHLSHKNYAQFKLEYLTARLDTLNVTLNNILTEASTALDHFVDALDKDDTDLDLWRRTATVGAILDSKRVARFCLESVLDDDEEGLNGVLRLPGLDEGLAAEQLRDLIIQLDDRLTRLQAPLSTGKRRILSSMLKQRLSLYDKITSREKLLTKDGGLPGSTLPQPTRVVMQAPKTWADLGDALLRRLNDENYTTKAAPGSAVCFDLGNVARREDDTMDMHPDPTLIDIPVSPSPSIRRYLPASIDRQFPGMDSGKPTVQPAIAFADPSMQLETQGDAKADDRDAESPTMTLPSRKRSGEAAGLPQDGNEEGRAKSRRTRARESTLDAGDDRQALIDANVRWEHEQQVAEFQAADDWMYETVSNLFERVGVIGFAKAKEVRQEVKADAHHQSSDPTGKPDDPLRNPLAVAKQDVVTFLREFTDQKAQTMLQGGDVIDFGLGSHTAAASGSPGRSYRMKRAVLAPDHGLLEFCKNVNDRWLLTQEVAFLWIQALLQPGRDHAEGNTYMQYLWPESLKTMVVQTLVSFDEYVFEETQRKLGRSIADERRDAESASSDEPDVAAWAEVVQSIFELHLDIYTLIKQPNSGVDVATITTQGDRVRRWSGLAGEAMHFRHQVAGTCSSEDQLSLRFLWATTFYLAALDDVTQDHVIECMNDLRPILASVEKPTVHLQNNAVMPEISLDALDREISKLTTKDFFLKVTSQGVSDPVAIIESLEPLLLSVDCLFSQEDNDLDAHIGGESAVANASTELVRFLQSSSMSVRFLLWQRLRDAYLAIGYQPMVVTTYLRMMRMIMDEVKTATNSDLAHTERLTTILGSMRLLQEMLSQTLTIIQSFDNALECVDDAALKGGIVVLGDVLQMLQVFNVFEDAIRVGQSRPPTSANGLPLQSFAAINSLIHTMQLHVWMILYAFLREAIYQNSDMFPNFVEDKFDFLRCVHRNLGLRGICGASNRVFVRMLKDEFVNMTQIEGYDSEQAQVLYDLYGLNCFINPSYELIEHHCIHDAFLERGVATQAVDLLLAQANKLPIKDLAKHSLKDTIDKVHGAVTRKKPTEAIIRNREIYRTFLRSPINPLDMFSCLKGEGNQLPVSVIPKEDALLASKGWYFLMGHIALTKFKTQKRTAPTPTEDVDIAIAFFMQDLEYSMDNWETWFRLAQAYDTKIEESVVWSAEKLNNSMPEIVQLQRAAIHCYTLATALAHRSAALEFETSEKMTELYQDFAMRLYSSSREPFSMLPFDNSEMEKFLSTPTGMDRMKAFSPLKLYTAWKLAKVLFSRAITGKPNSWFLSFMFGKCLWKMHAASDHIRGKDVPPSADEVLQAFVLAIEQLPDKKESREKREPTLEPHYKLVSIVYKLVTRDELSLEQAQETLSHTHFARTVTFPQEKEKWGRHVLVVLRNLRVADKSNWHHRMIARAAQISYDDPNAVRDEAPLTERSCAERAKSELTQQMFTKTMVLQVWRPECERAGRHFVYTARYTRFFTRILEQLKDRTNLEALARRVRRRPHDVFEHALVWQDICNAYLRLLRSHANLSEGLETSTFSTIAHEDFLIRREPVERWMQMQDSETSPVLDVLREVHELKKINQSLMKPGPIDDLIGDAYAFLFAGIGKQFWAEEQRLKQEEEEARKATSPGRNPMMSLERLMNVDGPTEPAVPADSAPPLRKKIGVGRREIRTAAESCNQKALAAPATKLTALKLQVVIGNSAPGSVHDSADDESELSEFDEVDELDELEEERESPKLPEHEEGDGEKVAERAEIKDSQEDGE